MGNDSKGRCRDPGRTTSSCHQRARNAERSIGWLEQGRQRLNRARDRQRFTESERAKEKERKSARESEWDYLETEKVGKVFHSWCAAVTSVAVAAAAATVSPSFELRVFSGARVVTMRLRLLLHFLHVQWKSGPHPSTGGDHLTRKRKRARCGSASRQTRIHSEETTGTACGDSTMATSKTETQSTHSHTNTQSLG